uniref:Stress response regulator protein 1 n=1 Tax=Candidozyma auris TaxID=498019 RepID=A0A0L0P6S4_CANAR
MMVALVSKPVAGVFECRSPMVTPSPEPVKLKKVESVPFVASDKAYHFLLVDDNIIYLRIFARILRKLFPQALVRAIQDLLVLELTEELFLRFDCVFLDIDMPRVTGIDVATQLRSFLSLDHVGLVAVTTKALLSDMELYESIGFDHTFPKPLNVAHGDLLEKIEQVVSVRGALKKR